MKTRRVIAVLVPAVCSAGLAMVQAGQPVAGRQVEQSFKTSDSSRVPFLLYLPEDYRPGERRWPLMLFLHGRGESDGPLSLVTKWGPPRMAARGDQFPFILISPQCPADDSWSTPAQQARLVELLERITKKCDVDTDRIYLTGLSMGGSGSWRLAADHPDRFAAVVPICGRGDPSDANRLKGLPIWVFVGDQDSVFEHSREMVEAINSAGAKKLRFTTLEHVGHNSWSAAYATPGLYEWLSAQKRVNE